MKGVRTASTTGVYGAPPGHDREVGGLPYYREQVELGFGTRTTAVCSIWEPSPEEREAIAGGANLLLELLGEPIPPVRLGVTDEQALLEI